MTLKQEVRQRHNITPGSHQPIGNCPFCGKVVLASPGQLIKYKGENPTHKACRKKYD